MPISQIYTLSLHDALPIYHFGAVLLHPLCVEAALTAHALDDHSRVSAKQDAHRARGDPAPAASAAASRTASAAASSIDRKSTRLNSSHLGISYAVFCLKKK